MIRSFLATPAWQAEENETSGDCVNRTVCEESLRRHLPRGSLSHSDSMKFYLACGLMIIALAGPLCGEESVSLAERSLKQLLERQEQLLSDAAKPNPNFDEANFKMQIEQVCRGYEELLRANPKFAVGYAAYGYLLSKLDQKKQSIAILLKANELDADQPLVKNQIGNYLAEEGKPLEALPYYMAAIKLAPKEPLYHYQLGTLLYEARDDFLKSGEWRQEAIDHAIHEAFRQAAELAPDRIEFTYRYAESFYDLQPPDWDAALKEWAKLEEKAETPMERETMRLHAANVLIKQGKVDHARELLTTIEQPGLAKQKEKLVAQLPPTGDK
jgi:tetratricopeptide (TPR) repeat protein